MVDWWYATPMTPDRSQAYSRVMSTITEVGPAKLHEPEAQRIRDAADTLLFAAEPDATVIEAVRDIENLATTLVSNGRWMEEAANKLATDVTACGPDLAPVIS